jgi:hypothetical protein
MSQFAAVTWKFKRGFDEELAQLFENCARPASFVIIDDQGSQMCALATAALSEARRDR